MALPIIKPGSRWPAYTARTVVGSSPSADTLPDSPGVLWTHETGPKTALPMPVFVAPDTVFVSTADDQFGGLMVRVTKGEDGF